MKCARFARLAALVAVGVIVVGVVGNTGAQEDEAAATQAAPADSAAASRAKIKQALAKSVSLEFVETPLSDVIQFCKEKYKIQILPDSRVLSDAGIDLTSLPISLKVEGISLQSALTHLLAQKGMMPVVQDEVLLVTTKENADSMHDTRVYGVVDLVTSSGEPEFDFDPLIDLITGTVATQTWSELGGPGTIEGMHGDLVVSQTGEVQESIAELLATLREMRKIQAAGKSGPVQLIGAGNRIPPKIEKLLALNTTLEYADAALSDVVEDLKSRVGIPFQFDSRILTDAGIDPASLPISIEVRNISTRAAIANLLRGQGLAWIYKNEIPLITTKENEDTEVVIGVYPVADLVGRRSQTAAEQKLGHEATDEDALIDLITGCIETETWSELGGPGMIEAFDPEYPALVIAQTARVHDQIGDLLTRLRNSRQEQAAAIEKLASGPLTPPKTIRRVYSLRLSEPKSPAMSPKEIVDTVKTLIQPKSWTGNDVSIQGVTGRLIVRQTPKVQREVYELLIELEAVPVSVYGAASASPRAGVGGGGGAAGGGLGGGGF